MAILNFSRRVTGGGPRKRATRGDLLVTAVKAGSKASQESMWQLQLRLSRKTMEAARWRRGDSVVAEYDDEQKIWMLFRCEDGSGNALTTKREDDASGTVRFSVSNATVKQIGLIDANNRRDGMVANLVDCTQKAGGVAKFSVVE